MSLLDLVNGLDTLKKEFKKQMNDIPRSYVRGSKPYQDAENQTKANYQTQKEALKEQIEKELVLIEAKADVEQQYHASLSAPTAEDIAEGYKMINVIANTYHHLSESTLEKLMMKVKDMDQLAVINDVINSTNDIGLKRVVRQRIVDLDSFEQEQINKKELVQEFRHALSGSNDEMSYALLNLATQLSQAE